ncbi:MAG: CocE/NonD family hydrolase [Actinomycetia bacterium]|nr:CocE/NonD family hydrolase [Actinomycetes bacterium]
MGTVALVLSGLAPVARAAAPPPATCAPYAPKTVASGEVAQTDVSIPMSDGVVLKADVHLPAGLKGRFPTSLTVTGYGKGGPISTQAAGGDLVTHGYASVIVDDRGTGASEGSWDSWGERTRADYREVLDWIARQPWSDGRVGVTGTSYMAISALFAAATGHPAVKGVFAVVPMADGYRDIVFGGGQLNTAFIPLWMGLVTGLGFTGGSPQSARDHVLGAAQFQVPTIAASATGGEPAFDGPFWRERSPIEAVDHIKVPTFIVGGLDDIFQRGEPLLYEKLAKRVDSRLLIGPWTHIAAGTGLPRDGVPSVDALRLQWFDQHVRGLDAHTSCIPKVTQFVRGVDRYQSSTTWPVPGLRAQRTYLRADGTLTATKGAAAEGGRQYVQAPVTGPCTRSTAQWLIGAIDQSPCATDNRLGEAGSLTYDSAPVKAATTINGPIQADLWVSTTGSDASVSVAVSDVAPDGTSRGLTNGLLLASRRAVDASKARLLGGQSIQPWHPFTRGSLLPVKAGEPMLLPIEVFPTSATLLPGHRLRITISPYDVPHALPPAPALLSSLGGVVTVLSDAAHASSVVFPLR